MFNHRDIWAALDRLAAHHNMTPSALARRAGLDPTTFNKSKRQTSDGRFRWPSTESLSKVLAVVNVEFDQFAILTQPTPMSRGASVPVIGLAQAGSDGFFDDAGFPVDGSWDDIRVPGVNDENLYALEISGDSMSPVLRDGDRIIVAPNAQVRRGDRVVVKTRSGEVMAKELKRQTETQVELISLNPDYPDRKFAKQDLEWMARIMWVTQ